MVQQSSDGEGKESGTTGRMCPLAGQMASSRRSREEGELKRWSAVRRQSMARSVAKSEPAKITNSRVESEHFTQWGGQLKDDDGATE